jgi:hypothetical protein
MTDKDGSFDGNKTAYLQNFNNIDIKDSTRGRQSPIRNIATSNKEMNTSINYQSPFFLKNNSVDMTFFSPNQSINPPRANI